MGARGCEGAAGAVPFTGDHTVGHLRRAGHPPFCRGHRRVHRGTVFFRLTVCLGAGVGRLLAGVLLLAGDLAGGRLRR